jgi:hypothetical protein
MVGKQCSISCRKNRPAISRGAIIPSSVFGAYSSGRSRVEIYAHEVRAERVLERRMQSSIQEVNIEMKKKNDRKEITYFRVGKTCFFRFKSH